MPVTLATFYTVDTLGIMARQSGWSGFGWTTISQGKNKIPFYKKQVINKSTSLG